MNVRPIEALGIAFLMAAAGGTCTAAEVQVRPADRDSYSIVAHGRWMNSNQSVPQMEAMLDEFQGDFVWFRRHGKTYVVRDRARLEEARLIFEGPDPERESLEREQKALARREKALDREQDRLEEDSDAGEDGPELDEAGERRLDDTKARRGELENEIRALDAKERDLDRKSEALEKAAEAKFWVMADRWIADGSAPPGSER
jgi:hypothetical protein